MELAAWSGAADARAVPAARDGVVSRPALFQRLTQAQRVVQVSALPGSGKTVLLRSWIAESGLAARAAWVSVRAPPALRFVLVTRHDLRLGLHRLRLAGELTEIRTDDLRFSRAEARTLPDAAGVTPGTFR